MIQNDSINVQTRFIASRTRYAIILLALAILGILATYMLAQEHHFGQMYREHNVRLSVFSDISRGLCGGGASADGKQGGAPSSLFNCERVGRSPYSRMLSLPQTSWGMFYFVFMVFIILPLFFMDDKARRSWAAFLFWPLAFGSAYSAYMLVVSLVKVRALCPLCIATYLVNWSALGVLVVMLVKGKRNPFAVPAALGELRDSLAFQQKVALLALLGVSLCAAIPAGLFLDNYFLRAKERFFNEKREAIISELAAQFASQPREEVRPSLVCSEGNPAAPVVVVEFSDFLCGHCKIAAELVKKAAGGFGDRVLVVFMHLPLDRSCNREMKREFHKGSCTLAKGAVCAARYGRFAAYMENAFGMHPKDPGQDVMRQLAALSGLDIGRFEECLASPATEKELQKQLAEAHRLNLNSTPAIFINGKRLRAWQDPKLLERLIRQELESQKGR